MSHLTNPLILESKTLWIGDIESWMDEAYIATLFAGTGAVVSVKVIRDKNSGLPAGYGFVEFASHQVAQEVLQTFHGKMIPGTNKTFRLNWGVFGGGAKPPSSGGAPSTASSTSYTSSVQPQAQTKQQSGGAPGPEHSIYVGELDSSVNDAVLAEFFSRKFKSVIGAKVIVDPVTKQSKGFGFVKFGNYEESQAGIRDMQGSLLRGRAIKTSQAYVKNSTQDSTMANLNTLFNPLTVLANNPLLMNMGLSGYGTQPTAQTAFPSYQGMVGGMAGTMPGMSQMQAMTQAYAGYQQTPMQTAQTAGYGVPNMGIDSSQAYQNYQGYQAYPGYQAYQGYQQPYAAATGVTATNVNPANTNATNANRSAFMGSFFDPTNAAKNAAQSTSPLQQTGYPGTGYQQYGGYEAKTQTTTPPQYVSNQQYSPSAGYFQQQQQYINYTGNTQQAQDPYAAQQQQQQYYQGAKTDQNAVNPNGASATAETQQKTETANNQAHEMEDSNHVDNEMETEKVNQEPIIANNTLWIGNSFRYDFVNSEKMARIL